MNTTTEPTSERPDPVRMTFLIFAIIGFMYLTAEVLKPLSLAILLSFALAPVARFLERRGLPRSASVVFTVVISLAMMGGIGYVVGQQLTSLAAKLPSYQDNIEKKLSPILQPSRDSTTNQLREMADRMTARMEQTPNSQLDATRSIPKVEVVSHPSFQDRFREASGPYLEFLGVSSFVLILVLFILAGREHLRDRIIGLFGERQVSVTTRTMQEIGQRISRYLATFALVNSGFGLVIGLGLALIGVRYAVLWGCLAAMLRFIPYVGPAVAFALPLIFSFAEFPGWVKPLEVVALFGVVEIALNSFLEPIIYGKTTGISALGLLVAAMFWTWLWGTLGLLLSTPLTVCLAVLGKYVPSLWVFAALLNEEAELEPDVRFYQRLVGLDREGALSVVESVLKKRPRVEVFDRVLIPALARAEKDSAQGELDDAKREFVWGIIGDILDQCEKSVDLSLESLTPGCEGLTVRPAEAESVQVMGLVADDRSDALILRMLNQLLGATGCRTEILLDADSSLRVVEEVAKHSPRIVVISHLPPEGATVARYLVRRLSSQFAELPIVVGRWGEATADPVKIQAGKHDPYVEGGASRVFGTIAETRDFIFKQLEGSGGVVSAAAQAPEPEPQGVA